MTNCVTNSVTNCVTDFVTNGLCHRRAFDGFFRGGGAVTKLLFVQSKVVVCAMHTA